MSKPLAIFLMLFGVVGSAATATARTVSYGGKVETIAVVFGTPTIVRFEKSVKTVTNAAEFKIQPASEESPDYTTLTIEARTARAANFATFILADGAIVRTKLVVMAKGPAENLDTFIDIKTEDTPGSGGAAIGNDAPEIKAIDLMKAMIRGDKVMGYEVRDSSKSLVSGDQGVKAELVRIYAGGELNGYVIHLTNDSASKSYRADVRGLRLGEPNLAVLCQVDHATLTPSGTGGNETFLRVVARPGAVYKDMVLPVAPVKHEKGGGA